MTDWKPFPETTPECLTHDSDYGFEFEGSRRSAWVLVYAVPKEGLNYPSKHTVARFVDYGDGFTLWETQGSPGSLSMHEVTHWAPLDPPSPSKVR